MNWFYMSVALWLSFLIFLCLYRVIKGEGVFNRIISVNAIGTKTVTVLIIMGLIYGRIDMIVDISLVYALLNFLGTLAAAKYFERKEEPLQ